MERIRPWFCHICPGFFFFLDTFWSVYTYFIHECFLEMLIGNMFD